MKTYPEIGKREKKLIKMKALVEEEIGKEHERYAKKVEGKLAKATVKQEKKQRKTTLKAGIVERDKGYQSYHTATWWNEHLKHGDEVVISYRDGLDDAHEKKPLFFDEVRNVEIEGIENVEYLCFQVSKNNLGNKSLTIPILPVNVMKVFSIRGEEYHKGKKFKIKEFPKEPVNPDTGVPDHSLKGEEAVKKMQELKELVNESPADEKTISEPETKNEISPAKTEKKPSTPKEKKSDNKDLGFEIVEKDGRFYCPCGNDFGKKAHAIYHHKNHLKKKGGK